MNPRAIAKRIIRAHKAQSAVTTKDGHQVEIDSTLYELSWGPPSSKNEVWKFRIDDNKNMVMETPKRMWYNSATQWAIKNVDKFLKKHGYSKSGVIKLKVLPE